MLQIIMQEDHEPLIPGLLSSVKVVLLCSNYFHSLPNKVRKAEENEKQNAFFFPLSLVLDYLVGNAVFLNFPVGEYIRLFQ